MVARLEEVCPPHYVSYSFAVRHMHVLIEGCSTQFKTGFSSTLSP